MWKVIVLALVSACASGYPTSQVARTTPAPKAAAPAPAPRVSTAPAPTQCPAPATLR